MQVMQHAWMLLVWRSCVSTLLMSQRGVQVMQHAWMLPSTCCNSQHTLPHSKGKCAGDAARVDVAKVSILREQFAYE